MSVGLFSDKKQRPTEAEIEAAIGPRLDLWRGLTAYLRATYAVEEDFRFLYGRNYGWALRFRVRRQLLTSLYPTDGGFVVQVNTSPQDVDRALAMGLGESVRQAIAQANPYPEGRWLFVSIESAQDVADVKELIAMRARDKRLG